MVKREAVAHCRDNSPHGVVGGHPQGGGDGAVWRGVNDVATALGCYVVNHVLAKENIPFAPTFIALSNSFTVVSIATFHTMTAAFEHDGDYRFDLGFVRNVAMKGRRHCTNFSPLRRSGRCDQSSPPAHRTLLTAATGHRFVAL